MELNAFCVAAVAVFAFLTIFVLSQRSRALSKTSDFANIHSILCVFERFCAEKCERFGKNLHSLETKK